MRLSRYIGDKQFYKTTIAIILPIVAQQLITTSVNLVDNVMIGKLGSDALTAVTVANKIYFLYSSVLFGFCGAASILIAQYYGSNNKHKCQKIMDLNLIIPVLCAILFIIAMMVAPRYFMGFFSTETVVLDLAEQYAKYAIWTYIPYGIIFASMSALRSIGVTKVQMYIGILSVAINTSLNYVLIFGHYGFPALGVEGAAIATLVARIVEMVIYFYLLASKKYLFTVSLKDMFKIDIKLLNQMFKSAIPLTVNEIMFSLGMSLIFISYVRCDESLIAAVSVVDTVKQIMFILFGGLSAAISILIGNRLGANEIEEAKSNADKLLVFGVFVSIIVGMIFIVIAPFIASLYNVEEIIKDMIIILIRIKSCALPFYVFNICIYFILRAGGDTISTMIMDSGALWLGSVLVSTVLSVFFDIPFVLLYIIVEFCDVLKLFVAVYFYKLGKWAKNMTIESGV